MNATTAKRYNGYSISTGYLTGNLFSDTTGIDEAASAERYGEMVAAAIRKSYPGAAVSVKSQSASGCTPHGLQTRVYDPSGVPNMETDSMAEAVHRITEEVFNDGEWFVDAE
jgi:hypothetical protein